MKRKLQLVFYLFTLFTLSLFSSLTANSQTEGTLTFTFTETVPNASKNVMAVWIVDNSGTFVKTRMRFWGNGTNDHLPSWKSNCNQNVVDAITGPTRTSSSNPTAFGVKTVVWDGKDVSGTTVADGTYKIYVESSWNNPEPPNNQHSTIINFAFEKSAVATNNTPTGNNNFSNITIDWVPAVVSGETEIVNESVSVYPNPSSGLVQINFKEINSVSRILVENIQGEVVYQETLNKDITGLQTLNLQDLSNGIYFIEVLTIDNSKSSKTKIILKK